MISTAWGTMDEELYCFEIPETVPWKATDEPLKYEHRNHLHCAKHSLLIINFIVT